jgi:predicted transcriptional regulator
MEIVWRREEVSVREVFDELNEKRSLAYTTVLSTLRNLYRKKFLQRRLNGTAYIYVPTYTRPELSRLAVEEIVAGLLNDFAQPFLACLADLRNNDELAEVVDQLEGLLKEKDEGDSS